MKNNRGDLQLGAIFVAIFLCTTIQAAVGQVPSVPAVAIPVVQCMHRLLKSSNEVQSVDLYSIDGFRIAVEYAFRNEEGAVVVSDIELLPLGRSVDEGDKIPREVSLKTAGEGQDLEQKLGLASKCHYSFSFDNLLPQPKARADWQKLDWPKE